jgi:hypothetical protein
MALVIMDLRWDTSVETVEFPIRIRFTALKQKLSPPSVLAVPPFYINSLALLV